MRFKLKLEGGDLKIIDVQENITLYSLGDIENEFQEYADGEELNEPENELSERIATYLEGTKWEKLFVEEHDDITLQEYSENVKSYLCR